jgi:type IV fimbrial biogenesis protein FimT
MQHSKNSRHARPQQHGRSMVEVLCALTIGMLLLGGAVPMLNDLLAGQRLQATAALLETDVHLARSAAIRSGQTVRLVVQALPAGGSCYMLHNGSANACSCSDDGAPRCDAGVQLLRSETQSAAAGVVLAPLARSVVFDGRKGTVTPTATLRLAARDGRAIHQVVNIMGRVRSCTPAAAVGGLRPCD